MLVELIVIVALYVWLGLTALVVVGCMAASRADARQPAADSDSRASEGPRSVGHGDRLVGTS
jgi:hypothetical protein